MQAALPRSGTVRTSLGLVAVAIICVFFADFEIATGSPWQEMGRLLAGIVTPDLSNLGQVGEALLRTLAFGFTGVALGAAAGFCWRWPSAIG